LPVPAHPRHDIRRVRRLGTMDTTRSSAPPRHPDFASAEGGVCSAQRAWASRRPTGS